MIERIPKFLISGGISTAISISILYTLTEWAHLWYLLSSVVAFLIGLVASFTLQKFWTFGDSRTHLILKQGAVYTSIQLWNLALNTLGMYFLVEVFQVWYLFAQLGVAACIAVQSFILYNFVFKKEEAALRTDFLSTQEVPHH
jgi:putative flippase GtrA